MISDAFKKTEIVTIGDIIYDQTLSAGERGRQLARMLYENPDPSVALFDSIRGKILTANVPDNTREGISRFFWHGLFSKTWNSFTGFAPELYDRYFTKDKQTLTPDSQTYIEEAIFWQIPSSNHGIARAAIAAYNIGKLVDTMALKESAGRLDCTL